MQIICIIIHYFVSVGFNEVLRKKLERRGSMEIFICGDLKLNDSVKIFGT